MKRKIDTRHSNVSSPAFAHLDAAYRATAYTVYLADGALALRVGTASPALDGWLKRYGYASWAFVSACNPGSRPSTAAENDARHARLVAAVEALGLEWIAGMGVPDDGGWTPEASLFIPGIAPTDALMLASRFGQNAIVCGTLGGVPQLRYSASPQLRI
ncbi:MAG TPA: DUF3293 domain-containing protein [Novimethylophilus sp.]|jgi:hypothetical protein|uniref:DUF3293 domain-containing protein n=1 Tax=Novimethylophilus sp. TaxID=2137426 RepID=UPI002F41EE48